MLVDYKIVGLFLFNLFTDFFYKLCNSLSCNSLLEELAECLRAFSKEIGGWEEEKI